MPEKHGNCHAAAYPVVKTSVGFYSLAADIFYICLTTSALGADFLAMLGF
jgi:hypothetical protein